MKIDIPAVSIVIPMYNAEKYIGDCLDSILAQTFDDYEVIIVDDCSTDKSRDIVESYLPKFKRGGVERLRLICSEVNSNTPGMPRNIGLRIARGEYIIFVDSDDAITETALEELYPIAKNFDADVVYCEKYYPVLIGEQFTTSKNLLNESALGGINDLVSEPTIFSENIVERLEAFLKFRFYVVPWNYMVRREFIYKHELHFPNIKYGEDNFWILFLVCLAKNIVRVPNAIYVNRHHEGSICSTRSLEINIRRYTDHVFQGACIIKEFAEKFSFLKEHPEFLYRLFNFFAGNQSGSVLPIYAQIPAWQLEPLIKRELDKIDDKTALTTFLFSRLNNLHLQIFQVNQIINQQQSKIAELQRRLEKG